jgi:hypothetical protein
MTFETLVEEIRALPVEQRKQLVNVIFDSLVEPDKPYSLLEFEGVGEHLADGTDAQDYIDELRREWDHPVR